MVGRFYDVRPGASLYAIEVLPRKIYNRRNTGHFLFIMADWSYYGAKVGAFWGTARHGRLEAPHRLGQ